MRARAARGSIRHAALLIGTLLLTLGLGVATAQANRTLVSEELLKTTPPPTPSPPPEGEIEGACGLAVTGSSLYVSDYYHRVVDVFSTGTGDFQSQIAVGKAPEGPCGLAFDSSGALYANLWHESVQRLTPSVLGVDSESSTGVAADAVGNVYVDDRTYIAKYETPIEPSEAPVAKIGLGSLGNAYGVAVFGGRVYVPDASTGTIKIYEPAVDLTNPVATITGSTTPKGHFVSLVDAGIAVDPSNEHLLVVDNIQPGFTHPKAATYEFSAAGAFLAQLPGAPIHGEPSGIAAASDGTLFVTDGNDEEANVFKYSPYSSSIFSEPGSPDQVPGEATQPQGPLAGVAVMAAPRSAVTGPTRSAHASRGQTQLVQKGPIRVAVSGGLAPKRLPRDGAAPITVTIGGRISSTDPKTPPQLRTVSFAFNRAGRLDTKGLPRCGISDIDPSTSRQALEACRRSLVGEGQFSANVLLPEQSPFPSAGKVLAFYGSLKGNPVIFAHVYGTEPVPTSVVMPLEIHQEKGTFGTRLDASLTKLTGDWGYVTGIDLKLGRKFRFRGEQHSFLSAGCPAPKGFPGALFPLARTSFSFVGGRTLTATLTRSCTVRG